MDHVCAHLKAYAVNRPDFRSLIGKNIEDKILFISNLPILFTWFNVTNLKLGGREGAISVMSRTKV